MEGFKKNQGGLKMKSRVARKFFFLDSPSGGVKNLGSDPPQGGLRFCNSTAKVQRVSTSAQMETTQSGRNFEQKIFYQSLTDLSLHWNIGFVCTRLFHHGLDVYVSLMSFLHKRY